MLVDIIAAMPAHEVEKQLKQEAKLLGKTGDEKWIFCYQTEKDSAVLFELGRLRELTFRAVGEGSGQACDINQYDYYYDHLILWDDIKKAIVGSYRMITGERAMQVAQDHPKPLYIQSLFELSDSFQEKYFAESVEMGRSFIQPEYWGTRSLDYLWYGIAAYFVQYPNLRYFLGAISITHDYPQAAKELLVDFYLREYSGDASGVKAKHPFLVSKPIQRLWQQHVNEDMDYKQRFQLLKKLLKVDGVNVPTLYKQYAEMYEPGGVQLLGFTVNKGFADAIDGLIVADTHKVKEHKKQRYLKGLPH